MKNWECTGKTCKTWLVLAPGPIETQALLIEAFQEIGKDTKTVDDLRTWLLKNKQTNNWRTTKATAEACYALLLQGTEWLTNEPTVEIKLGNTRLVQRIIKQEAGTGYFKKTIEGKEVKPEMGKFCNSTASNPSLQAERVAPPNGVVFTGSILKTLIRSQLLLPP